MVNNYHNDTEYILFVHNVSIPVRFTPTVRALETAIPERGNRRDECSFALLRVVCID